ncbi:hypothetical protein ILUMI_20309 [Ignelater luminosus]|uniref:Uncharacterized protein n=1 Tax=Ignelater luminosus TaxID=2038154 RepID=A0A8K0CEI3_IGNLU|nr:hypothetical protein ILUMI_20309 [Ignelater luminosus]
MEAEQESDVRTSRWIVRHGLTGKSANRKTHVTPELRERRVKFIKASADQVAVPLPDRLPQFKDFKDIKFTPLEQKLHLFYKLWSKDCPYITSMKPADDLCDTCHQNAVLLMRAGNVEVNEE